MITNSVDNVKLENSQKNIRYNFMQIEQIFLFSIYITKYTVPKL